MANSWGESGTTWSQGDWGQQNVTTIYPSGLSITASLGTLPYAQSIEGWGRDEWGYGNWGENTTTVIVDGLEMTTGLGPGGWGIAPWEEMVSWGGDLSLQTTQLSIAALTGIEATASLGTPTINYDFIFTLSESLLGTLSLGTTTVTDMAIGVSGYAITASLGTITEVVTALPSGYEATMSLGTIAITSNPLIVVSGYSMTGSLGSLTTIPDMAVGVSGYSMTASLGSVGHEMVYGITGLAGTLSLGSVSPLGYKDIDIIGNTSYSDVDITGNTSYTDVTHAG